MKLPMKLTRNDIMLDPTVWDILRSLTQLLVLPLIGAFGYFFKKAHTRIDKLEEDMGDTKTKVAVIESQIDTVCTDIKDIKRGVEKLIERRQTERK